MSHDPYQILPNPFSLDGYSVIITGAGGAIGGATAHVLAQAGANVVVSDLNLDAAEKVAADVQKATGRETLAMRTDDAGANALLDEAAGGLGCVGADAGMLLGGKAHGVAGEGMRRQAQCRAGGA